LGEKQFVWEMINNIKEAIRKYFQQIAISELWCTIRQLCHSVFRNNVLGDLEFHFKNPNHFTASQRE